MRGKRLRPLVAALAVLLIAGVAALLSGAMSSSAPTAKSDILTAGEGPPALSKYLATAPGVEINEGPASAGDAAFLERAYPDTTISVGEMENAREAFSRGEDRHSHHGKENKGRWRQVGPSTALYPFEDLRELVQLRPERYVAGGRTTSIAIDPKCEPQPLHGVHHAGGRRRLAHEERARRPAALGVPGRPARHQRGRRSHHRSATTRPATPSTSAPARRTSAARAASPGTGLYKSTERRRHLERPIGRTEFQGKGIGAIVIKPGDPKHDLRRRRRPRCAACRRSAARASHGRSRGSASGASTSPPTAARRGASSTTARRTPADCTGDLTEFNNAVTCSPRGVRARRARPVELRHRLRVVVRARRLALERRGGDLDADQAVAQRRADPDAAGDRRHDAPERQDPHVRLRGQRAGPDTELARLFRSDDVATGAPVFTDLTSTDPARPGLRVPVGICDPQCWYDIFVYTPPGYPDIVYVGGDYSYGETIANKRGVILSDGRGCQRDGHDVRRDGHAPPERDPSRPALARRRFPATRCQFIETGDGGVMRSSGAFVDRSSWCDDPNRGLTNPVRLARCKQLLSAIPSKLESMNDGLSTLQFQSLSVSPFDKDILQGGTQDNGTWQNERQPGQVGEHHDRRRRPVRLRRRDPGVPVPQLHGRLAGRELRQRRRRRTGSGSATRSATRAASSTSPVITDPLVSKTMFAGTRRDRLPDEDGRPGHDDHGRGTGSTATSGPATSPVTRAVTGPSSARTRLTDARSGATGPEGTWPRSSGPRRRLVDGLGGDDAGPRLHLEERRRRPGLAVDVDDGWTTTRDRRPDRFVSSIYVDPANGNHAWISYSGFDANTPADAGPRRSR